MDIEQHLRALRIAHIIYSCLLIISAAIGLSVALVVGILNILCFPFGTALGGYSLWVFTKSNEQARHGGQAESSQTTHSSN